MENAVVDFGSQTAQGGRLTVDLAPNTMQASFYIRAISRSQPVTVHFVVVDRCGDWPTFVGHGPGVTQAAVATATPPGVATATLTGTPTASPSLGAASATPTRTATTLATATATATSAPKIPVIGASPAAVKGGQALTVTYADVPNPSSGDVVGLFVVGTADRDALTQRNTNGQASGTLTFPVPDSLATGQYELRLFGPKGTPRYAISNGIQITEPGVEFFVPVPSSLAGAAGDVYPDPQTLVGQHTSVAVDRAGRPVVSYYDAQNGNLKLLRCGDPTCTRDNSIVTVDGDDRITNVGQYTSLRLNSRGLPVVSYYDVTNGDLKLLVCSDETCAGARTVVTADSGGQLGADVGQYSSLVLDANDYPVVSYYDATTRNLKILRCASETCLTSGQASCTAGSNCITTPDGVFRDNVGQHTSIALDLQSRPVVSYYDATYGALKVLRCGDVTCTGGNNSILTADAMGNVGQFTSLALDTTGPEALPVVSYYDVTNARLKLLRCGSETCISDTKANSITVPDPASNVGQYSSLKLDGRGIPVISYYDAATGDLKVVRCGNRTCTNESTIAIPDHATNVGQFAALALDAGGRPVVSYYDATTAQLKVLVCLNASCIPTPDTLNDVGQHASLRLDSSGNPVVSYYEAPRGDPPVGGDLKVLRCSYPRCVGSSSIATPDGQTPALDVGQYSSLALDSLGRPVVSYYDQTNGKLRLLLCGNANCTFGNRIEVPDSSAANVGQYTSLALDGRDRPIVSYYDVSNGDLKLLLCGNTSCDFDNRIVVVDSAGDVGQYTSLALGPDGTPVVSYYDVSNGDLKLARCETADCSGRVAVVTLDAGGNVGQYTSLALDAGGNPVVSYYDASNLDLKVLRCDSSTCAGGARIGVPDAVGNVGRYTSLALDSGGNPVISYHDSSMGSLKLIHCSTSDCGNTFIPPAVIAPDRFGNVGQFTSLRLDAGVPVIAYYDTSNGDLKVLRCRNTACN